MYHNQEIGKIGEDIALKYLESCGYRLITRNCNLKVSEIDLIMRSSSGVIHFIEVKTGMIGGKFIFDNLSAKKRHKLARAVELYIAKHRITQFQTDFAFVKLNMASRIGSVEMMWNQVLE